MKITLRVCLKITENFDTNINLMHGGRQLHAAHKIIDIYRRLQKYFALYRHSLMQG